MFMWWLFTMLLVCFRVASLVSFGFVPELWGFVRLRPFDFFMDSFILPTGISGKMTIPSKSLLSLLASCSLFCYAAIPTTCYIMPRMLPCQASNPPCPSKPLFGYVTALLSPSYSVASCRWRWSLFLVGTCLLLGYHNISYLINASIHLVKGGRLGLMPGVLFHSCRPSFCHTEVMFLDFAFLTRLGYNGNPLTVRLE